MLKKIKYYLGKFIQKGIINQLLLLLISILVIILISSYTMSLLFNINFDSMIWKNFMFLIDQGAISGENGTISYLAFLTSITFIGIFLWSTVVAILNEGIRNKLDILRNGITHIQEKNHVIILGWDESIPFLLKEYIQTEIKTVLILCEKDEEELYGKIKSLKLEVLIKQAKSDDINILEKLNFKEAKAIIVFPQDDENALKQILAIKNTVNKIELKETKNIAIIIHDNVYKEIFLSLEIKNAKIMCINREEILQKIAVQSIVFDGLISVFDELLSYKKNEFYIVDNPFSDYSVINISKKCFNFGYIFVGYVSFNDNIIHTNPSGKIILSKNDKLIIIANSFPEFKTTNLDDLKSVSENTSKKEPEIIKNILSIGKRGKMFSIINSSYKNQIHSIKYINPEEIQKQENKIDYLVNYIHKNAITRILLNSVSESDDTDLMAIYILIKHILATKSSINEQISSVLFRVNAIENSILLNNYNGKDLIISGHIIAGLLGQASIEPQIFELIEELLNCHKNEFGIIPISETITQKTFQEAYELFLSNPVAERKTLIGIKRNNKIYVNPPATTILLENDKLIVIADFIDKF